MIRWDTEPEHDHLYPAWSHQLRGYECAACPCGLIPCAYCGTVATSYRRSKDNSKPPVYSCDEKMCDMSAYAAVFSTDRTPTPRITQAVEPIADLCCEQYYGIPCQRNCKQPHQLHGSKR